MCLQARCDRSPLYSGLLYILHEAAVQNPSYVRSIESITHSLQAWVSAKILLESHSCVCVFRVLYKYTRYQLYMHTHTSIAVYMCDTSGGVRCTKYDPMRVSCPRPTGSCWPRCDPHDPYGFLPVRSIRRWVCVAGEYAVG